MSHLMLLQFPANVWLPVVRFLLHINAGFLLRTILPVFFSSFIVNVYSFSTAYNETFAAIAKFFCGKQQCNGQCKKRYHNIRFKRFPLSSLPTPSFRPYPCPTASFRRAAGGQKEERGLKPFISKHLIKQQDFQPDNNSSIYRLAFYIFLLLNYCPQ